MQRSPDYAHNDFLNLTADYGLVGLALGLGVLGCFYWQAIRLAGHKTPSEQRAFAIGALVATTIILIHSWFDFNLHIFSNALLLATLMGCVVAMDDPQKRFARFELPLLGRYGLAVGLVVLAGLLGWSISRSAIAHRHFLAGKLAKMHLDYDIAVPAYERARAIDPNNPDIHIHLGHVYLSQSLWLRDPERVAERRRLLEQAIAAYQKALALQPLDSLTMLRLAKAYEESGDLDQSLKILVRALEVDPNSAEVNLRLGKFYEHIGERDKASAALNRSRLISDGPNYSAFLTLQDMEEK